MTNGNYLTVGEVAELLGTSTKTVYKYIREAKLVASKIGKSWKIKREDLEEFERSCSNVSK